MLQWVAVYDGNETLPQYNEDGTENSYSDIDRERLERFVLTEGAKVKLVLNVDPSKKLIYRRRVAKNVMSNSVREIVHIVGYQENIEGVSRQNVSFIFESTGHIESEGATLIS